MKIAFIYDTFKTYGLEYSENECDFCSIATADSMRKAMIINGHSVEVFNTREQIIGLKDRLNEFDLAFNTFEGRLSRNREALIPSYLEFINLPFIGADASVAIKSLDKVLIKLLATSFGINTPKYTVINMRDKAEDMLCQMEELNLPIIIKPIYAGNSESTKVFKNYPNAIDYINTLKYKYANLLCEEFIIGKELTVPIIGNGNNAKCLGITSYEEQRDGDFWLDSKYKVYGGFTDCKAELPDETQNIIYNWALKLYHEVGCLDYSRIDFRLDKDNNPYVLEINAYPDLYESGSFALLYALKGKKYCDLINDIIQIAGKRNGLLPK